MRRHPYLGTALFLGAVLLVQACGSNNDGPDTALGSVGGSGGRGSGGKGGSNALGGSGATAGSSASGGSATGGSNAGGSSASGGTGGSVGGSAGTAGVIPSGDACSGLPFAGEGGESGAGIDACRGISYEAEPVPVDLFLMMDRSSSLDNVEPGTGMTRWEIMRSAVATFLDQSASAEVRVGIGFFGRTGGNDDALDCNADYYAIPKVEIGEIDQVGGDILAALDATRPGGLTPTGPALAGALRHASEWAVQNVGRATAVVLITDAYPTQCQPMAVSQVAAMAEEAHMNEPYVRTYVIGLAAEFNLDAIAIAGGTHAAYLLDEADPTGSFVAALRNVSNTKLACRYEIPPPPNATMQVNFEEVQITYTAGDMTVEEVPRIYDYEACARNPNGGWYYDDPAAPTQILVCPCTCARFEAGRVDVAVGCKPRVGIR